MPLEPDRIQKPISKLRKLTKRAPKDPSPEEVHKIRTNARKLEAILGALSLDEKANQRQVLKRVRRIRKRAGKARDLDVLTDHLSTVRVDGEADCRLRLVQYLGSERRKQSRKLYELITKQRADLNPRLRKTSSQVDKFLKRNEPEPSSLAAARALRLSSELRGPKHLNHGNLHPYRLKVKELRYVLQLGTSSDPDFVENLGRVKDAIGEWHDWEELVGVATEVLDHPGCKLVRELKRISNLKYDEALRASEELRARYTKRPAKKRNQTVTLSPAAISATSTLALDGALRAA